MEWQLADAKNRFSELVNQALHVGPQRVRRMGGGRVAGGQGRAHAALGVGGAPGRRGRFGRNGYRSELSGAQGKGQAGDAGAQDQEVGAYDGRGRGWGMLRGSRPGRGRRGGSERRAAALRRARGRPAGPSVRLARQEGWAGRRDDGCQGHHHLKSVLSRLARKVSGAAQGGEGKRARGGEVLEEDGRE